VRATFDVPVPDVVQKWRATSEYLFPTLRDSDGAEHRLRCVP